MELRDWLALTVFAFLCLGAIHGDSITLGVLAGLSGAILAPRLVAYLQRFTSTDSSPKSSSARPWPPPRPGQE